MSNNWNDFNSAEDQQSFDLIPKGSLLKVRMTIKPGGYDDASQGWSGGFATQNFNTGSVYLQAEFIVLEGEWVRRKMWSNIGLYSDKGPKWGQMGRSFIKSILNSARGLMPNDNSVQAQEKRRISGIGDLDGIEFIGRVDFEKDQYDNPKNVIKNAVTPDHKDYAKLMGQVRQPQLSLANNSSATNAQTVQQDQIAPNVPNANTQHIQQGSLKRPNWAQ